MVERETGLEPATACLEGRVSQHCRSFAMNSFIGSCTRYKQRVIGPDKRCREHFLMFSAKDVTCIFRCLRQKMSTENEGRMFPVQATLEPLYQNFCTNTREAGGLPTRRRMTSCPKAGCCLIENLSCSLNRSCLLLFQKGEKRRPGRARGRHHLFQQGAFGLLAEAEVR